LKIDYQTIEITIHLEGNTLGTAQLPIKVESGISNVINNIYYSIHEFVVFQIHDSSSQSKYLGFIQSLSDFYGTPVFESEKDKNRFLYETSESSSLSGLVFPFILGKTESTLFIFDEGQLSNIQHIYPPWLESTPNAVASKIVTNEPDGNSDIVCFADINYVTIDITDWKRTHSFIYPPRTTDFDDDSYNIGTFKGVGGLKVKDSTYEILSTK